MAQRNHQLPYGMMIMSLNVDPNSVINIVICRVVIDLKKFKNSIGLINKLG